MNTFLRLTLMAALVAGCLASPPAAPASDPLVAPLTESPGQLIAPPTATAAPATSAAPAPTPPPAALSTPGPTASPSQPLPTPTPVVLDPAPRAGKFEMDLSRPKAFVRQATVNMCVPASMQIMINLMSAAAPDRSRETQRALYTLARSYSPWITPDRVGASANGWAAGLEHLGYGDFEPMSLATMDEALNVAARQMRYTGKPVGLIVWAGDHAWVMSGFKATADPAWTDDFAVTSIWIEDPWFGRTDRTWGTGLAPHTLVATADLGTDFVAWPSRWFYSVWGSANRYVIVAPQS